MARLGPYDLNTIVVGDCLKVMGQMPDACVDLVVTSPPYNCGKDYGVCNDRWAIPDYFKWAQEWLAEILRVLSHGGRLALNGPFWMGKKPKVFAPKHFILAAEEIGFIHKDWIMWVKGTIQSPQLVAGTAWGTFLSPSGPCIRSAAEPIMIFAKGARGRRVITGEGRGKCLANDMTKQEFFKFTQSIWEIPNKRYRGHPATFTEELAHRLIKLYTWQTDWVFDPFIGSGTTAMAADRLGRKWFGCDINPEYVKMSLSRIHQDRLRRSQMELPL